MATQSKVKNDSAILLELKSNLRQYSIFLILLVIGLFFSILTHGVFNSARNISNLFLQTSALAIAAIGVSLVLVSGNIDLSIGSVVGLAGAVSSTLMLNAHWGTIPTILVTLGIGLLIGCWHGFWIAYRGIPSFIVTLAGLLIYRGLVIAITKGMTVSPLNASFKAIGQNYLPSVFSLGRFHGSTIILGVLTSLIYIVLTFLNYRALKKNNLEPLPILYTIIRSFIFCILIMGVAIVLSIHLGVPYAFLIVLGLAVIFSFVASNTILGRHIYAIGGSINAARLSGINIKKTIFMLYFIMGGLVSLSGILFTARINAGTPGAGTYMELDAIAAAIIGGTSLSGGEGSVFGAILGALIMTSIDNGMSIMNIQITYQYVVKGLVLLLAVWIDISTRRKSVEI